jgi:hypothetical protein
MVCNCIHAVDLACTHPFKDAHFHRLHNCFLPMLDAFDKALAQNACIHAERDSTAPFAYLFLKQSGSKAHLNVHERLWNSRAKTFPPPQTRWCGNITVPTATINEPSVSAILLQKYMNALMKPKKVHSVIVLRKRTRRFMDERRLLFKLRKSEQAWEVYRGTEPLLATLNLFGAAQAVAGYHGAGLLNVVFSLSPRPRVHEITTFSRINSTSRWRAYVGDVARHWNSKIKRSIQMIPLENVMSANGIPHNKTLSDRDIKDLRWVPLSEDDMNHLKDTLVR